MNIYSQFTEKHRGEIAKSGLLMVSLLSATAITPNISHEIVPHTPLWIIIFLTYPIMGALVFPVNRFLKRKALGGEGATILHRKIWYISFWPVITLVSLAIFPCLIIVNILVSDPAG